MFAILFLFLAVLVPITAHAQALEGIALRDVVPLVTQGGIAIIIFVIWYFTYKSLIERLTKAQADQTATTAEAFRKHGDLNASLISLLQGSQAQNIQTQKDNQESTSLLVGTLSRLEVKLAQPVQCPLLDRRLKIRGENINEQ